MKKIYLSLQRSIYSTFTMDGTGKWLLKKVYYTFHTQEVISSPGTLTPKRQAREFKYKRESQAQKVRPIPPFMYLQTEFDIYTILCRGSYWHRWQCNKYQMCLWRSCCTGNVAKEPQRPHTLPDAFIGLVNGIVNTREFYDAVFLANTCSGQIICVERENTFAMSVLFQLLVLSEMFEDYVYFAAALMRMDAFWFIFFTISLRGFVLT